MFFQDLAYPLMWSLKRIYLAVAFHFQYLMEAINVVQWTMYLTSICMVMPTFMGTGWGAQQFNSASLAIFTAWFTLLLYLQRLVVC